MNDRDAVIKNKFDRYCARFKRLKSNIVVADRLKNRVLHCQLNNFALNGFTFIRLTLLHINWMALFILVSAVCFPHVSSFRHILLKGRHESVEGERALKV